MLFISISTLYCSILSSLYDSSGPRCGLLLLQPTLSKAERVVRSEMLLHSLVVAVVSLPVLLTSRLNKTLSSTQLPFTGYFLFFKPFSVNPGFIVCENPS